MSYRSLAESESETEEEYFSDEEEEEPTIVAPRSAQQALLEVQSQETEGSEGVPTLISPAEAVRALSPRRTQPFLASSAPSVATVAPYVTVGGPPPLTPLFVRGSTSGLAPLLSAPSVVGALPSLSFPLPVAPPRQRIVYQDPDYVVLVQQWQERLRNYPNGVDLAYKIANKVRYGMVYNAQDEAIIARLLQSYY